MRDGGSRHDSFGSVARRLLSWFLCLCAVFAAPCAAGPKLEYDIKAAFLLNFTKFVDWPVSAFASPASPFTICILGEDPFGAVLDQVVEGESVGSHRLAVKRIRRMPAPQSCHVLFIPNSENNVAALLSELPPGILTVGDQEAFLDEGGMIAFVIDNHRVRFDISLRAAGRGALTVSSRLLSVARRIQR